MTKKTPKYYEQILKSDNIFTSKTIFNNIFL